MFNDFDVPDHSCMSAGPAVPDRDSNPQSITWFTQPPLSSHLQGTFLWWSTSRSAFRRFPERFPNDPAFERSWQRVLKKPTQFYAPQPPRRRSLASGLGAHRLHLVPLGHDPLNEARYTNARTIQYPSKFVLAVGTLEPRKIFPLIEAFNNIAPSHDVELVLAGPIGWGYA